MLLFKCFLGLFRNTQHNPGSAVGFTAKRARPLSSIHSALSPEVARESPAGVTVLFAETLLEVLGGNQSESTGVAAVLTRGRGAGTGETQTHIRP